MKRELYCDKKHIRNTGKVITFVTNAITCLVLLKISDSFGRRFVIWLNSLIIVTCLFFAWFLKEYYLKMFMLGLAFGSEGDLIPLFIFLMAESTSNIGLIYSIHINI